jgi:hypothetical protein
MSAPGWLLPRPRIALVAALILGAGDAAGK